MCFAPVYIFLLNFYLHSLFPQTSLKSDIHDHLSISPGEIASSVLEVITLILHPIAFFSIFPYNRRLLLRDASERSPAIAVKGTIMASMSDNSPFASMAIMFARVVVVPTSIAQRLMDPFNLPSRL